jgi:hypothetical protein
MAASFGRKRVAEPMTVPCTHTIDAAGPPFIADRRPMQLCAASAEKISRELERDWRAVLHYRVLEVSIGGAGISIGGPE